MINHNAGNTNDTWLTPPRLLEILGPFDLDPCCPPNMPWATAAMTYVHGVNDGLTDRWHGIVWCNPPFSKPLPWIERMVGHGCGIMLLPAKSPETRWGQRVLSTAGLVLLQRGRMLFHYIDGTKSTGKWSPYMLAAYGEECESRLRRIQNDPEFGGVLMRREIRTF